jgi:hypothetical protein
LKILENFEKAFPTSHYIRRMEPMEQPAKSWSQQMEQQDIMTMPVITRAEPNPAGHSDEEEIGDLDITMTLEQTQVKLEDIPSGVVTPVTPAALIPELPL